MRFDRFYTDLLASPDIERVVDSLWKYVTPELLEDHSNFYPSFNGCLGFSLASLYQDGLRLGRSVDPKDVKCVESYLRKCLSLTVENRTLYNMSIALMKPSGFIDWHYDMHARSMVCERLHIPMRTHLSCLFYAKNFNSEDCFVYRMEEGHVYRFNNRVPHAVKNDSSINRVHLVLDYVDVEVAEFLLENRLMDSWRQLILAPIRPIDRVHDCVPDGCSACPSLPLFGYSKEHVTAMNTSIPDDRNVWKYPSPGYQMLLSRYA